MKRKSEITIWGYYGFKNLGDDVMLDVCLNMINKIDKYERINVYGNYSEITKVGKVIYHPLAGRKNKYAFLKSILASDKLIWGGGTCFYKESDTEYSGLILLFIVSLFCALSGKKNYFLAVGIGNLSTYFSKLLVKNTLRFSHRSVFRDKKSFEKAAGMVGEKKIELGGDLVLLHELNGGCRAQQANKKGEKYISVSGHFAYVNDENLIRNFVLAIKKIAAAHAISNLVFVSMHQSLKNNDHIFHEELKKHLAENYHVYFSDESESIELIAKSEFHIGMRLHSLVFSTIHHVPVIPFTYSPKINYFIENMFLDGKVFNANSNLEQLNAEEMVCKKFNVENLRIEKHMALKTLMNVISA